MSLPLIAESNSNVQKVLPLARSAVLSSLNLRREGLLVFLGRQEIGIGSSTDIGIGGSLL